MTDPAITAAEIGAFLRKIHVFGLAPAQRAILARNLADYGITVSMLRIVWDQCQRSTTIEQARGLMAKTCRDPRAVAEIVDDVEQGEAARHREAGPDSGMQYVADGNPYGWRNRARMQQQDQSEPGAWSSYRQCWNMSTAEAREAGTTDVRRHGCSRVEVMGEFDKARCKAGKDLAPDPFWNPDTVQGLRTELGAGLPATFSTPDTDHREIFGVEPQDRPGPSP